MHGRSSLALTLTGLALALTLTGLALLCPDNRDIALVCFPGEVYTYGVWGSHLSRVVRGRGDEPSPEG